MAKMTVYHGGYISVENPQVRIGRNYKGFWNRVLLYRYQGTGSEMGKTLRYKSCFYLWSKIKFGFEHQRVSRNDGRVAGFYYWLPEWEKS